MCVINGFDPTNLPVNIVKQNLFLEGRVANLCYCVL